MHGLDVVGSPRFDGLGSRDLIRVIEIRKQGSIALLAVDDLIADCMDNLSAVHHRFLDIKAILSDLIATICDL